MKQKNKIIVSVIFTLWFLVILLLPKTEKNTESNKIKAEIEKEIETEIAEEKESKTETKEEEKTTNSKETHIYDKARIGILKDRNGVRIGKYSIIIKSSSKVTDEALTDWYFNYVMKNKYDYYVIFYSDKYRKGTYSMQGTIHKNVRIDKDEWGNYIYGGKTKTTKYYIPTDEKILKEVNLDTE